MSNSTRNKSKSSRRNTSSTIDDDNLSLNGKWIARSGISFEKWKQVEEEEEKQMVVLHVREKLLEQVWEITYDNYLEKQVNPFIVECSYMAWKQLIKCYFQRKDPGEPKGIKGDSWKGDKEPPTSELDSWASHIIPVASEPCDKHRPVRSYTEYNIEPLVEFSPDSLSLEGPQVSPDSSSMMEPPKPVKIRKKLFKRGLDPSMNEDPVKYTTGLSNRVSCVEESRSRRDSLTLPAPMMFHPRTFPSSRVEVQYAVQPDHHPTVATFNTGPFIKNITLKKSIDKGISQDK